MTRDADHFYMGLALELARYGLGRTSPNPLVGCAVVRDGRIVGRGYHARAGEPHAEVHALREAGDRARNGCLYVNLEPCSHQGRTPPCVDAVLAAGVSRVVIAQTDPNPRVAGRSVETLRRAGVETLTGVREAEARRLNEAFNHSIASGRCFVHLKLAATLDGKIATRTGDSRWITSPQSRERVHRLRDRCGAIAVGVGTVDRDDPRLTVRLPGQDERRIPRVILDPDLRVPAARWMLGTAEAADTWLVCRRGGNRRAEELVARGCRVLEVGVGPEAGLDLEDLCRQLYAAGLMELLVEGGAATAASFLAAGRVNRVHLFYAPKLLGGQMSLSMLGGVGPERIEDALSLGPLEVESVGSDLYVTAVPEGG